MKLKVILAFVLFSLLLSCFFYVRFLQSENERLQSELMQVINANKSLNLALEEENKRHKKELQVLSELKQDENKIKEKIIKVKEYVYKSNENNLTKLFNDVLSRLWQTHGN